MDLHTYEVSNQWNEYYEQTIILSIVYCRHLYENL